ncbi:hypothetical protein EPUS_03115 [Endocarpon pusillum Z07020]|uniref:O-methyltransferase C-terminal domain-containing protein n=1 Tax=Endocarpon pusillum (strain Z07020 / HMAS-L-300199) TaxID=1263415 RepID=U1GM15_ENDPU|nr:uncharacterized protein EPUS_03115 [Endocarpon pusillum Z07020]ERF73283.1 hypothetical protein EPUS_03115 [Endocarpon pusillum Z07020]
MPCRRDDSLPQSRHWCTIAATTDCGQQAPPSKRSATMDFKPSITRQIRRSAAPSTPSWACSITTAALIRSAGNASHWGWRGARWSRCLTEDIYPFEEELPSDALIVDVGGGLGQVSTRIAEKIPRLRFLVQDQAGVVEVTRSSGLPDEVEGRVSFIAHDFFEVQPVKYADVYLFRFILHDHPDSAYIRMRRHIISAMHPTRSRILIDDAVIPDLLGSESIRMFSMLDIHMAMRLNAKERTRKQREELCRATDERLVVDKIWEERDGRGGP